jgi:hypothetical protein
MGIKVETYGVRETLAELHKYERSTSIRIRNDLKSSAEPLASLLVQSFLTNRSEQRTTGIHLEGVKVNQKCLHTTVFQRRKM